MIGQRQRGSPGSSKNALNGLPAKKCCLKYLVYIHKQFLLNIAVVPNRRIACEKNHKYGNNKMLAFTKMLSSGQAVTFVAFQRERLNLNLRNTDHFRIFGSV